MGHQRNVGHQGIASRCVMVNATQLAIAYSKFADKFLCAVNANVRKLNSLGLQVNGSAIASSKAYLPFSFKSLLYTEISMHEILNY